MGTIPHDIDISKLYLLCDIVYDSKEIDHYIEQGIKHKNVKDRIEAIRSCTYKVYVSE